MKRAYFILMCITPIIANAQLKVNQYGRVNIGTATSNCKLTVDNLNSNNGAASFYGYSRGIDVTLANEQNDSTGAKVGANISLSTYSKSNNFGILSMAHCYNQQASSCAGVFGRGTGRAGYTYGVVGSKTGSAFGAGILGTTSSSYSVYVDGSYAGYFNGNVKVTGTINGTLISNSDVRLKENINDIGGNEDESVLDKLDLLTPISYNYINTETTDKNAITTEELDSLEQKLMEKEMSGEEKPNQVLLKKHYGLIAQELQQVYPDLVYENDNGYLSINYTELIPIMLQSIKDLKAQVDEMRNPTARKAISIEETTDIESAITDVAGMNQNVPNPFSGKTDIAIYLPETVKTAMLYIYDLSGKQIEQHVIEGRDDTVMTIYADKMNAGMYIYSLIADNKVMSTKRMIVVK